RGQLPGRGQTGRGPEYRGHGPAIRVGRLRDAVPVRGGRAHSRGLGPTSPRRLTQREWTNMNGIRRVTVLLLGAPVTRRARRDVWFCVAGAITGVAGFALIAVTLVPALAFSATVAGAVVGLPLAVAATGIARWLGAAHRRALWRATGERVTAPEP